MKFMVLVICSFFAATSYSLEIKVIESMVPHSADIYTFDEQLRAQENEGARQNLLEIQKKASELGVEFFEAYTQPSLQSKKQAEEYRYLYVPILYKLGMSKEAADLAQATFEYLFPQLHQAIHAQLIILFGPNFDEKCNAIIQAHLSSEDQIDNIAYRVKSTHSIWKKIPSLKALEKMSKKEFALYVNDFIGLRLQMRILKGNNAYDALINGIAICPLEHLVTFRNQQLHQQNRFASEPVMKLCYVIDGIPLELQLLGGNITAYLSAKGYAQYKTSLAFCPKNEVRYENCRLSMAIELGEGSAFRKYMFEEHLGATPDYSAFAPFVLDTYPLLERNRTLRFSASPTPICELPNLNFELLTENLCLLN